MTEIAADEDRLTIGEETVTVRHEIVEVLERERTVLAVLYPGEGNGDRQNVVAFDTDATKLWESDIPDNAERHMFAGLREEDGKVIGWSWNKHEYRIDLETGELEDLGRASK